MAHLGLTDMLSRSSPMATKWIKKATSGAHGQFRARAERAGESTSQFAREHESDSGLIGRQARLALTLMGMHHKPKKKATEVLYTHPKSNPHG